MHLASWNYSKQFHGHGKGDIVGHWQLMKLANVTIATTKSQTELPNNWEKTTALSSWRTGTLANMSSSHQVTWRVITRHTHEMKAFSVETQKRNTGNTYFTACSFKRSKDWSSTMVKGSTQLSSAMYLLNMCLLGVQRIWARAKGGLCIVQVGTRD